MDNRPPCSPARIANSCAAALYEFRIHGIGPLGGDHWRGWRLAGRMLVSPDGDRISPERLRGLLWREKQEKRFGVVPVNDAGSAGARVRHLLRSR